MDISHALFGSFGALARTALVGALGYAALVAVLRVSGRRTLSKRNAFDLVVTVALGSILASTLLSRDVSLAQGVLAGAVLVGLPFAITWTSVRVPWVRRVVTGDPVLLLYRGLFLESAMQRARIHPDEVLSATRAHGLLALSDAEAVVLETDGSFSVVPRGDDGAVPLGASSLRGVTGVDEAARCAGPCG